MSRARQEPPTARASGLAQPKVLLPIIAVLGAGLVALGILFAFFRGDGNGGGQDLTIVSCTVGEPGCESRQPIHEHANFGVFVRGKAVDFNRPEYLSEEGNDRSPYAHLHEPRYGVVHVHVSNTTWDAFFRSIGFELTDPTFKGTGDAGTCLKLPDGQKLCNNGNEKLRFIVNGVKVDGVSATLISDLDRVLIAYGSETDEQLRALYQQVGDDACIPSGRCLERGKPDEEKCATGRTCS